MLSGLRSATRCSRRSLNEYLWLCFERVSWEVLEEPRIVFEKMSNMCSLESSFDVGPCDSTQTSSIADQLRAVKDRETRRDYMSCSVLQCMTCNTVLGDSLGICGEVQSLQLIVCLSKLFFSITLILYLYIIASYTCTSYTKICTKTRVSVYRFGSTCCGCQFF